MKTVRILCYLPEWGDGHIIDNVIDVWTWFCNRVLCRLKIPKELRCSHKEIEFPNEAGMFEVLPITHFEGKICGECYTSTMRGEENGVVLRPAKDVLTHPDRWNYFEIEITDEEYKRLYNNCRYRASLGLKYGKMTILSFFLPQRTFDPQRPICSGECWYVLCQSLMPQSILKQTLDKLRVPSPTRLAYNIWKCGYELRSLATGEKIEVSK